MFHCLYKAAGSLLVVVFIVAGKCVAVNSKNARSTEACVTTNSKKVPISRRYAPWTPLSVPWPAVSPPAYTLAAAPPGSRP